ncbi:hypothetical protein AMK26_15665 [Streptomyces sp. CB03234]|uniref:ATP-grasp domain-containing protein n=1 Tax=Streptomyces sp. (strain CB03234) TaxID=1703937 RepID=UPI00093B0132|nr:ATP-grasp domain-containing protein [Streptomyces sp. CB03234]OKK04739.1 hypothetical protein AMK26_15665 [Streptomyces sp. CB03234]
MSEPVAVAADGVTEDSADAGRLRAFVLLGGFGVICRNPEYLEDLRDRGLRILLVTPAKWRDETLARTADPTHPASAIDDVAFVAGSMESEGTFTAEVIAHARRWRERYDIAGVYAVGEILVEQAGLVADALGLRSPGLRAGRVCRSKYLQRWYLDEWSPASTVVPASERDAFDPAGVRFPAVVKPAARHSSSGVTAVTGPDELRAALARFGPGENALVEEKVAGQEFSVEALVQDGKPVFASVTTKETTESVSSSFVELSHSVPCPLPSAVTSLLDANSRMLEALGFQDGIAHSEWRLTADGRVRLMEVAARTPGDGLLVLYHLATGEPLEKHILKVALGEPTTYPRPRRYTRQVYLDHEPGVLSGVELHWPGVEPVWVGENGMWPPIAPGRADDPPTLRGVLVLRERGSVLGPLRDSDDRAVTFFIDAAAPEELDALEQQVRTSLHVRVTPG